MKRSSLLWSALLIVAAFSSFAFVNCRPKDASAASSHSLKDTTLNPGKADAAKEEPATTLDTAAYNQRMVQITNGDSSGKWPVKGPYPRAGAILPFKRVIAYYGNLYSKQMGILGELPEQEMLAKLDGEVKKWEAADPATPVQPALHYIAVTAQLAPGSGNKYRLRMPFAQIDKVLAMAEKINAIVFVDIQVGLSNLESEVPALEKYLKMPNVHLGVDPEFSMKTGHAPGKVVGTFDAADINYTIDYLAKLVKENNLPPKILVVHRFTGPMVTNSSLIRPKPEVQVVMHMDGWGEAERKIGTYKHFIYPQPVQFTGFKIFYKNDTKKVNRTEVMQPAQLLKLKPQPMYIQYQ
jgi:hypothetical protein